MIVCILSRRSTTRVRSTLATSSGALYTVRRGSHCRRQHKAFVGHVLTYPLQPSPKKLVGPSTRWRIRQGKYIGLLLCFVALIDDRSTSPPCAYRSLRQV